MADILVIGSLNMDLVVEAQRAPGPGETVPGRTFRTISGGKGANQAAAIARLGGRVAMAGRVGADQFGAQLRQNLRAQGVDVGLVTAGDHTPTGTAHIVVEANGENRIIVVPGANGEVSPADVDAAFAAFPAARLLVLQFEIPMPTVAYALDAAARAGRPVILNPAPMQPVEPRLLEHVGFLVLNETEAQSLCGIAVTDVPSAAQAATSLRARGPDTVIITLGQRGALLASAGGLWHVTSAQVESVDTTAAGDAFIGGFAVSLLDGLPLSAGVRFANAAGALTVTRFGAQTSLPLRAEVDAFLAAHPDMTVHPLPG